MAKQKIADDECSNYHVFEDCWVNTKCLHTITALGPRNTNPVLATCKTTEFQFHCLSFDWLQQDQTCVFVIFRQRGCQFFFFYFIFQQNKDLVALFPFIQCVEDWIDWLDWMSESMSLNEHWHTENHSFVFGNMVAVFVNRKKRGLI